MYACVTPTEIAVPKSESRKMMREMVMMSREIRSIRKYKWVGIGFGVGIIFRTFIVKEKS